MPNHCHNDLWVSGPEEEVKKLLAHIGADKEKPEFDFNTIIPYPERLAQMDNDYQVVWDAMMSGNQGAWKKATADYVAKWGTSHNGFNSGGYGWCVNNWGTKWNAYDVARRDYDGVACITFQTAWSPPRPVIVALHQKFPNCRLSHEYFESGCEFCGGSVYMDRGGYEDYYADENGPFDAKKPFRTWHSEGYGGDRGG